MKPGHIIHRSPHLLTQAEADRGYGGPGKALLDDLERLHNRLPCDRDVELAAADARALIKQCFG